MSQTKDKVLFRFSSLSDSCDRKPNKLFETDYLLGVFDSHRMGGARPKASVLDPDNHLWIAKFPSKNDEGDMGAWEIVTYELAIKAGINMAECQAKKFSSNHHTFLTKRFDRINEGNEFTSLQL